MTYPSKFKIHTGGNFDCFYSEVDSLKFNTEIGVECTLRFYGSFRMTFYPSFSAKLSGGVRNIDTNEYRETKINGVFE